ncbi:hypothetical protein C8D70_12315 [Chryseobacterium sp. CBTAP 102]|uniref:DUF5712 family protein n=1 Tax=Chryseobacterium sp. CBTAP 102 TaxID=2135644 RepID=UPI000D753204|nr:DUF5712 family protein [Chryseobacterium sp. CBTAP 102]PXW07100.1 hypothetical protein C8D70_12315 [Chryseobacterium sp. CBTAP 102]
MYSNFKSHDVNSSTSSTNIFHYLDKENQQKERESQKKILEEKGLEIESNEEGSETGFNSEEPGEPAQKIEEALQGLNGKEHFFNQDFNPYDLNDPNSKISVQQAIQGIDGNRGTKSLKESNFYMFNLAPSQKELKHLEDIAISELESRGLILDDIKDKPEALEFYNEQKDQLMKLQIKLYTQKVMDEYARLMDREIYANQEDLPKDKERRQMKPEIEKRYKAFLQEKGIKLEDDKPESAFLNIERFKIKQEYDHGKIFTLYSEELEKNIDLFVPENKYKVENDKLFISEEYYSDKYNALLDKEKSKKEQVEILASAKEDTAYFTDFIKEDKICITRHWDKFDKELKLYFDRKDVEVDKGICFIPESTFKNKLYEIKSQFLAKEFSDKKKEILNSYIQKEGFDVTKGLNDKGEEVFLYPEKVPSKEDYKKLNIKSSVEFNKFLVKEKYLEDRPKMSIKDWNSTTSIKAKILVESEKATLLSIEDQRLEEPVQMWVGNFAIKDPDDKGNMQLLTEFYEYKINELITLKNESKIQISEFQEIETEREKFVKNSDSIKLTFDNTGLKEPLNFNVQYEDIYISPNGKYTMERNLFEHKFEKHIMNQAQKEFAKEYNTIKENVNKEMLEAKDFLKNKEIDRQFKNFLIDKNILQDQAKDDNYFVQAKVLESKNNSSFIAYKPEGREEEVRFWVNNAMISKAEGKEGIYFKSEKEITKILEQAVQRDDERKQLVEIDFKEYTTEDKKHKEEEYKNYIFLADTPGLTEPIKFTIKEADLKKEGEKFLIEKYKLDNKIKNAIKYGIAKEFGNVKDDIKNQVWKEKGFDTTKRKVTGKDLLYYAKVETERTYKHNDKSVLYNRPILKEIEKLTDPNKPSKNKNKIAKLTDTLQRDRYTGEIIKEGVKKGGLNYHSHIVVSRHDKTSVNPEDKVSMSPNSNQKDNIMANGAKVGFDRSQFFENIENIFDKEFGYERDMQEHFKYKQTLSNQLKGKAEGMLMSKVKQEITEKLGLRELTNHSAVGINLPTKLPTSAKDIVGMVNINNIKSQISELPLPTSLPKGKLDAVIKAVKYIKNLVMDKGM